MFQHWDSMLRGQRLVSQEFRARTSHMSEVGSLGADKATKHTFGKKKT